MFDESKAEEAAKGTIKYITLMCKWLLFSIFKLIVIVLVVSITLIYILDNIEAIKSFWNSLLSLGCVYLQLCLLVSIIGVASIPIQMLFNYISMKIDGTKITAGISFLAFIITDLLLDYFKMLDLIKPLMSICK